MAGEFASQVMSQIGQRVQARLESSLRMNEQNTKTQADNLWQELLARDPDDPSKPLHSDDERQELYDRIQGLYKGNPNAKGIIQRAQQLIEGAHGLLTKHGKSQQQQPSNLPLQATPPPGQTPPTAPPTDAGATEGSTGGMPDTGAQAAPSTMPFTPPPPGRQLPPVQATANAAAQAPAAQPAQQPAAGGPTPPPPRARGIGAMITGGGTQEAQRIAETKAAQEAETKRQAEIARIGGEYKLQEQQSKNEATLKKNREILTQKLSDKQEVPIFDEDGNLTGTRPKTSDELTELDKSIMAKNQAAVTTANARTDMAKAANTVANARADIAMNPNNPNNMLKLAQMRMTAERLALSQETTALNKDRYLAQWFGKDANGNDLPGAQHDEFGNSVGTAFSRYYAPTSTTLTRAQSAFPVVAAAQHMIAVASDPANADLFGPEGALKLWAADKIGTNDKRLSAMAVDLESLPSFLRTLHGVKADDATKRFKETLSNVNSPEAFSAALDEYIRTASTVSEQVPQPNSKVKTGTGTVKMQGPGGTFNVPVAKQKLFEQNGYSVTK